MKIKHSLLSVATIFFFSCVCTHISVAQKNKKGGWWKQLNSSDKDSTAEDYLASNAIRYEDAVYKSNIKSVQLGDESFEMSQPLINMDGDDKLKLSFDDLDADRKNFTYAFIHCNADWQPSDLLPNEYTEGFSDNPINDYSFAFNTLQKYTHYFAIFPNNNVRLTKSGNYILKVYENNDPDNIVLTRRFMIFKNKIKIQSRVKPATIVSDRNYKQEIDFTINRAGYNINNPYGDLQIVITQNNRWDNARKNLKPLFVRDDELVYDYDDINVFNGGNEFRNFDTKSVRYITERVYKIRKDTTGGYRVELLNDENRAFKRYVTVRDINGKFLIKNQDSQNSDNEADYCNVCFFIPYENPMNNGNLYVFGGFNAWQMNQENKMKYNYERLGYECNIYVKQGYYNYEYVFLPDKATEADETLTEGNHQETENDYTIYVYHRAMGTFYDQLIGVKKLNSITDR
jgi:Domain of unknown function (DUF5103)